MRFICLKLLNEKNDDEDEEARAGLKKRNELLQQLLKDQDDERKVQEQHVSNRYFSYSYCIKHFLSRENNSINVFSLTRNTF